MKQTIAYAASQDESLASTAVPLSGLMALPGGVMIAFGYRVRIGSWLIVLLFIGVPPIMHRFWGLADPALAHDQMSMKELTMMQSIDFIGRP